MLGKLLSSSATGSSAFAPLRKAWCHVSGLYREPLTIFAAAQYLTLRRVGFSIISIGSLMSGTVNQPVSSSAAENRAGVPEAQATESSQSFALTVWGAGQLCAFSGLDGATDYDHGLVAQTIQQAGLRVRHPGLCQLVFGDGIVQEARFGSDWWQITTGTGTVRGCFLDAHHLLCEGPVTVTLAARGRQVVADQAGDRTLVASLGHQRQELLNADLGQALRQRQGWINDLQQTLPLPAAAAFGSQVSAANERHGLRAWGQLRHRSTTPDQAHREVWLDSAFRCHWLSSS